VVPVNLPDDDALAVDDEPMKDHNVKESFDKIRLHLKLTRGNDTRDQDAHTLKVRAENPEQAADRAERTIAELADRGVFEKARAIQPEPEADDE